MPTSNDYTARVAWGRHYVDRRTYNQLKRVEQILGHPIVMYQGSWSFGALSAATHSGAGAADIGPTGPVTWRELETAGRAVGGAVWFRPWAGNYHCHFLSIGNPALAPWAKVQVSAYMAGYDGLGPNARTGRDSGVRLYQNVTWESYLQQHKDIPDPAKPSQEETMKRLNFTRAKPQALTAGSKYQWLQINDVGDSSWATGPCVVSAVLNLRLTGLKPGQSAYIRPVEMAVSNGTARRNVTYELTEIPGTAGDTFVSVPWVGQLGANRRTRFEINTAAKGVKVVRAEITYLKGAIA